MDTGFRLKILRNQRNLSKFAFVRQRKTCLGGNAMRSVTAKAGFSRHVVRA